MAEYGVTAQNAQYIQQLGESEKDKDFERASTTLKIQIDLSDQQSDLNDLNDLQNVAFPSASLGDSPAHPFL